MDGEEQRRHRLARRLAEVLGEEEAETLMSQLPPYDWPQVATKQDLDALRDEMGRLRTELRGEISELRGHVQGEIGQVRGEIGQLRTEMAGQLRTFLIVTVTAVAATGSLAFAAGTAF